MVIRAGENVSPREIEEFLHTHPDVQDVQVIGVPDARLGEEIMAWIRLRPGAGPITTADVRAYAAGKLAHYKILRHVRIVDGFAMTASGKVRKVEMRKAAINMLGLTDIAASQIRVTKVLRFTPIPYLTPAWGFHDHPLLPSAAERARLLPGSSSRTLAGRTDAAVNG
jgi:AMP-binding enzyme C-terminal domain